MKWNILNLKWLRLIYKCLAFNAMNIKCELWTAEHINHSSDCVCRCISEHEWHLNLTSVAAALSQATYALLTVYDSVNDWKVFSVWMLRLSIATVQKEENGL